MKISDFSINSDSIAGVMRCLLRTKKQLLILSLADNAQLSLWQQECLWQETQDDSELEAWLHDTLLAHDVEEGAAMLIVLGEELLLAEQLTLPKLPAKQLKKTLAWEAGQLFNLPQGSYSYCYQVLTATAEITGQTEQVSNMQEAEQQVIQLWALEYAKQAEYTALAQRLMVKLEGVCVRADVKRPAFVQEEASEVKQQDNSLLAKEIAYKWFAGEALLLLPALPRRIDWRQCYGKLKQYLPRAAHLCGRKHRDGDYRQDLGLVQ